MSVIRPTEVSINERDLARLTNLYKTAYAQIVAEMETATNFGIANRKILLVQIQGILKELDSETTPIVSDTIAKQYELGAGQLVDQLEQVAERVPVKTGFNRIHKDAIAALVSSTQESFAESIQGVYRSSSRFLNDAVKTQMSEQMALGKLKGEALRTIRNNVAGKLREEGLSAITDKAGREWSLDRYAEMLIRTKSVEARNTGVVNRMIENEYDLAQVSAHGADDACADWEGVIISVRGVTDGYPTLDEAESAGLFHPRCRHAINTLIPELAKLTNAYNPNIDTLTGQDFVDDVDTVLKGYDVKPGQIVGTKTPAR